MLGDDTSRTPWGIGHGTSGRRRCTARVRAAAGMIERPAVRPHRAQEQTPSNALDLADLHPPGGSG
jgi:hypothetical protein